jgi:hypothetical protein
VYIKVEPYPFKPIPDGTNKEIIAAIKKAILQDGFDKL